MEKILQFQVIADPSGDDILDILALTADGRMLIRRTTLKEFELNKWAEITFPPKKEKPVEKTA